MAKRALVVQGAVGDTWPVEEVLQRFGFAPSVEVPSLEGGYRALYNPGGPGPEPFEGVRYAAPGPPDLEPVIIALDDPMRVSRDAVSGQIPWPLIGGGVALAAGVIWFRRRRSGHAAPNKTRGADAVDARDATPRTEAMSERPTP